MRLAEKIAIVTGAASGFGAGIAKRFSREGASVILADIDDSKGEAIAAEIQACGGKAEYAHADVASRSAISDLIHHTSKLHGKLDILVNNAGFSHSNKPFTEVDDDEFDRIYEVNVKAIYIAIQEAIPIFKRQGSGCVINTSSTAAIRPRGGLAVYCSSKGAVSTLTKSLALELASYQIRVNALCPVLGETGMLETFMGVPDTPENRKKFEATIPMGRFSTPEDVANAALFLASDDASFITGIEMEVDGGRCV